MGGYLVACTQPEMAQSSYRSVFLVVNLQFLHLVLPWHGSYIVNGFSRAMPIVQSSTEAARSFPPLPLCLQSLFCKLSCCLKILLDLIDWMIQKSIRLFVTQSFAFLWAIPIVYSSIESTVSFDSLPVCNVRC